MMAWVAEKFEEVGVEVQPVDLGRHVMDGQDLPLPNVILGRIGNNPNLRTGM